MSVRSFLPRPAGATQHRASMAAHLCRLHACALWPTSTCIESMLSCVSFIFIADECRCERSCLVFLVYLLAGECRRARCLVFHSFTMAMQSVSSRIRLRKTCPSVKNICL